MWWVRREQDQRVYGERLTLLSTVYKVLVVDVLSTSLARAPHTMSTVTSRANRSR
jgi:hypothetical protein